MISVLCNIFDGLEELKILLGNEKLTSHADGLT